MTLHQRGIRAGLFDRNGTDALDVPDNGSPAFGSADATRSQAGTPSAVQGAKLLAAHLLRRVFADRVHRAAIAWEER